MQKSYKHLCLLCLFIFVNCGGRNKKFEAFKFPNLIYKKIPYSITPFPDLSSSTSKFFFANDGIIENPAPLTTRLWNRKSQNVDSNTHSEFLKRELQRKTGRRNAPLPQTNETCGEADMLMAELASTLRLPITNVSIIGDFSPEGFLYCGSFEKALLERVAMGATHVLGPKNAHAPENIHYAQIKHLDEAIELLGGPKAAVEKNTPHVSDAFVVMQKAVTLKNKTLQETLKKHWPLVVEISNGAGVDETTKENARSALKHAQKAKNEEELNKVFAAHQFWSLTLFHAEKASETNNPLNVSPANSKDSLLKLIDHLRTQHPLFKHWRVDVTLFEEDKRFLSQTASSFNLQKWFEPLSRARPYATETQLKNSAIAAMHRLNQLSQSYPMLPLYFLFTADQLEINKKETLELYRIIQGLTELYTAAWLSSTSKIN